jgi:DNA-binding transcriptional regulator LsrR (DeoR family)
MYDVDVYARVRRAVLVEGKSRRAVAREFGLARKTIRKVLEYSLPPMRFNHFLRDGKPLL